MTYRPRSKYVWAIPLVGAILTLIGFLTPIVYRPFPDGTTYFWVWDLRIGVYSDFPIEIAFTKALGFLIPSIICSTGVFISIIVIFSSVRRYKKSIVDNLPNSLLGASIALIIFTIGWIASIDAGGAYNFWDLYKPHFGVFGLFIGSAISIVGYAYSRYTGSGNIPIPKKTPFISTSKVEKSIKLNFCPECGSKLESETQKFCVNCGFHL